MPPTTSTDVMLYRDGSGYLHASELRALIRTVRVTAYKAGLADGAAITTRGKDAPHSYRAPASEYHAAVQALAKYLDEHAL